AVDRAAESGGNFRASAPLPTPPPPLGCFPPRPGFVLVVEALDDEDRARDARQIFFDVPAAEVGMEPDVVPSPKGARGVAVIAAEEFRQIRGLEAHLGLSDATDA